MTALMTAESRGASGPTKNEKIAQAVAECKRLNIPVLPPDINTSGNEFSIEEKKSIRFGLSAVKNVGTAAIETILSARNEGHFTSFVNFCERVDLSKVNKKTLESLIKAGAFDKFGKRANLLIALPSVMETIHKAKKQSAGGQESLFDDDPTPQSIMSYHTIDVAEFSQAEKLSFEKEFLGIYLSSHPQMENLLMIKTLISHELELLPEEKEGTVVKVGGIIES